MNAIKRRMKNGGVVLLKIYSTKMRFIFIISLIVWLISIGSCAKVPEQKLKLDNFNLPGEEQEQSFDTEKGDVGGQNTEIKDITNAVEKDSAAVRIANIANKIEGVNHATVIVLGNVALIGLSLYPEMPPRDENNIPKVRKIESQVEKEVGKAESKIAMISVTSDPDLVVRIQEIAGGLRNGEPLSDYWNEIGDLLQRTSPKNDMR